MVCLARYKAHLHQAIIYANSRKYNLNNTAEKESVVQRTLLQYASREEWVNSEFGKSFTEKGIQTFFGN